MSTNDFMVDSRPGAHFRDEEHRILDGAELEIS